MPETYYVVAGSSLTSVANAIRTKGGTQAQLEFPTGFVSAIGDISGGDTVYTSSTGFLYTPVMTIDMSMDRSDGYKLPEVMSRYGSMPYLVELTLTGIVRVNSDGDNGLLTANLTTGNGIFNRTKYPLLKKLKIQPTEKRTSNGSVIASDSTRYNNFLVGDNVFDDTNLTELVLGKVGGPYVRPSNYAQYRTDMPVPPGNAASNIGSLDGITITVYSSTYLDKTPFLKALAYAPNTTYILRDYITGEVLTA